MHFERIRVIILVRLSKQCLRRFPIIRTRKNNEMVITRRENIKIATAEKIVDITNIDVPIADLGPISPSRNCRANTDEESVTIDENKIC